MQVLAIRQRFQPVGLLTNWNLFYILGTFLNFEKKGLRFQPCLVSFHNFKLFNIMSAMTVPYL